MSDCMSVALAYRESYLDGWLAAIATPSAVED